MHYCLFLATSHSINFAVLPDPFLTFPVPRRPTTPRTFIHPPTNTRRRRPRTHTLKNSKYD